MSLTPGTRLGSYEVIAPLGAGGMGEVYRARDMKLARDVALKVLPSEFAIDPDRLARFKREAQVLASLNHPHIAAIYGFEDGEDLHALVLELVDGPTLADRIAQGRLPIDEALPIARQIAEALETAHEQGIIHRDLKPANVKVRADGAVKVLDFGLAKLIEGTNGAPKGGPHVQNEGLTASPTITTPAMTMAGVILGTAAYMSPEQAKGRPADKRSDIWAFGCVLFEMLTGTRAFEGDDVSDTLAAVLRAEPDWRALPVDVPERMHGLLRRCLRKDASKRLPHMAMARYEIEEVASESPSLASARAANAKPSFPRRAMPLAIVAVLVAAMTSAVWWMTRPQVVAPLVTRFVIPLADDEQLAPYPFRDIAISPDGSRIVYATTLRLKTRSMSDPTPKVIPGTDTGLYVGNPVFSPDGRSIAYVTTTGSGGAINTISLDGGAPVTIAQTRTAALPGLSWGDGGVLYSDPDIGIMRVAAVGQKPEVIVPIGAGEAMQGPSMLPGGAAVVFSLSKGREPGIAPTLEAWDTATIVAQALPNGERHTLIQGGSEPHYLPTGHLLYARGGTMYLAPFDLKRREVTGASIPVLEGVARTLSGRASTGYAQVAFSQTGSLVYLTGPAAPTSEQPKLVMIDRAGRVEPLNVPSDFYERPRVSPDGRFVAVGTEDAKGAALWIHDVSGNISMRRLTFDGRNRYPVWSHDGAYIAFQSDIEGDSAIFVQRSDGSTKAERLTKPEKDTAHTPESWSRDGKHLLYAVSQGGANTLWTYSFDTKTSAPFGDVRSPRLISSTFSPDGRWVAYTAPNAGQNQVFVQPFPATGTKYLVGSGARPQWSPDGAEIFYYRNEGTFVRKVMATQATFTLSNEAELPFNVYAGRGPGGGRDADIMPDGKRFVAVVTSTGPANSVRTIRQLQVVLDWFEEVKSRVPSKQ